MPNRRPAQPRLILEADPANQPLAARLRPRSLDEFVGQERILAPRQPLRRAAESGQTGSLGLWGPPGSGKTTLAHLIAAASGAHTQSISAVTEGLADLRQIVSEAREA